MNKEKFGFLVHFDYRIPYWVSEDQAEKIANKHGGNKASFMMALPGYGIMDTVEWHFEEKEVPEGRQRFETGEVYQAG